VIIPRKLSLLFIKISKNAPLLLIHSYRIYNVNFHANYKNPLIFFETDRPAETIEFPGFIGSLKNITNNQSYRLVNMLKNHEKLKRKEEKKLEKSKKLLMDHF